MQHRCPASPRPRAMVGYARWPESSPRRNCSPTLFCSSLRNQSLHQDQRVSRNNLRLPRLQPLSPSSSEWRHRLRAEGCVPPNWVGARVLTGAGVGASVSSTPAANSARPRGPDTSVGVPATASCGRFVSACMHIAGRGPVPRVGLAARDTRLALAWQRASWQHPCIAALIKTNTRG